MEKHRTQKEINEYLQDICIKNAQDLLDIEDILNYDGLELPNNVVINRNGICSEEFIKWYTLLQYPKTYEECCDILQLEHTFELKDLTIDEEKLMDSFIRLKRCRDAYWKISGEPDTAKNITFYITYYKYDGNFILYKGGGIELFNNILSFPTEEIRDAFYENFKDLIEQCKELL